MELTITVLTDNQVDRGDGLLAEHGLCLLAQAGGCEVLLDTGQTDVCLRNARRLGVDLGDVNAVVLSHGHYDHGGGLPALLDALGRLEVIAHPGSFASKYARRRGQQDRHIGLAYSAHDLIQRGGVFRLEPDAHEISGGLIATGSIPRITGFEKDDPHFWVKADGSWEPDHFKDDQALVARTAEGLVVMLGCAHAGVINTLRHAVKLTGDERIRAVLGGLHLASASLERTEQTVAALGQMDVGQVVACHCSGFAARIRLQAAFKKRFVNGTVGLSLTF
ncbi:MAG: MBL fold metallo-hydrolase [Armatimonadota bacterium]|nr:MAG: MBL fold metallo-hydrolase [Armatimonadota bacterium]